MSALEIRRVESRRGAADFIAAAVTAQSGNTRWVRPLDIETRLFFNSRFSPFAKRNVIERFVTYRAGVPVGRIAAIHDSDHLERHRDSTGHFGFIEAIDDAEVFAALTSAAELWLAGCGLARISGPFSGSINHEVGLLISGFQEPHVVKTNYAPPHYGKHLADLGYRKAMDLNAYRVNVDDISDFVTRVRRISYKRPLEGLTIRKLKYSDWKSSFMSLLELYNAAWAENWKAVPLSAAEGGAIADFMLPLVKPGWIEIAEYRGEPIAILALIPDANEVISRLRGRLLPWRWLHLLWGIHFAGTGGARVPLAGVAPRWRRTPVAARALFQLGANAIESARAGGVKTIELSWVLEINRPAAVIAEIFEPTPYRTFRIFEKDLTPRAAAPEIAALRSAAAPAAAT